MMLNGNLAQCLHNPTLGLLNNSLLISSSPISVHVQPMQLIANLLQANWAVWSATTYSCSTGKLNAGPTEMGDSVRTSPFRYWKELELSLEIEIMVDTRLRSVERSSGTLDRSDIASHTSEKGKKHRELHPNSSSSTVDPILQHPDNPGKPDGVPNIAYTDHQRLITKMFKIFQNESVALGSKLHDDKAGKCTGHLHLRKQRLGCFRKVNDWINSRNGDRRYH